MKETISIESEENKIGVARVERRQVNSRWSPYESSGSVDYEDGQDIFYGDNYYNLVDQEVSFQELKNVQGGLILYLL